MAGFSLETSNKFGKLYVFTRLALLVLLLVQIILLVVAFIRGIGNAGWIIWCIFVALTLFIGLLAAWREHFLTAAIFALIEIVLAITGYVGGSGIVAVGTVLCLICAIGFAIMLYLSGSRDMGMPQIC